MLCCCRSGIAEVRNLKPLSDSNNSTNIREYSAIPHFVAQLEIRATRIGTGLSRGRLLNSSYLRKP